jgi:hypothetical protein
VETSIDDFLTRPVTDIFNSGLTLETMQFRNDLGGSKSSGGATPSETVQKEWNTNYERAIKLGQSEEQARASANTAMKKKLEGKETE